MAEASFTARRILVAVDASATSLEAVAAAAALALRLGAELAGVFVEDEDLLRLAALPFARLVRSPGGEGERLDRGAAELALRAVAARARDAVERAAARHGVSWSFRVMRGRVAPEVLSAADEADLVVLGAAGHGRRARSAVGETARATAARARVPVLLLARGARLGGAVAAVDDGGEAGARAVAAARAVAPEGSSVAVLRGAGAGTATLLAALGRLEPALAVLPAAPGAGVAELAEALLAAGMGILLVR